MRPQSGREANEMVPATNEKTTPTRTSPADSHKPLMERAELRPEAAACSARRAACKCNASVARGSLERLAFAILLPFLLLLLAPTLRLDGDLEAAAAPPLSGGLGAPGELLLALLKLPLERARLQWGGLVAGALAKELVAAAGAKQADLQEEETHMLLLAPAEHRSSYAPAPGPPAAYQYGEPGGVQHNGGEPGGPQQPAPGDYGAAADEPASAAPNGGQLPAPGESAGLAEPVGSSNNNNNAALQARSDLPAVRALNVKCEKNHMTVNIVFDRPFYGMVFSKGHYNDQKCVHLAPNSGQTSINFDIHLGKCGMSSSDAGGAQQQLAAAAGSTSMQQASAAGGGQQPNGVYIENTIIIQYDPLVQEIFDQARKLRCTWYDYYEKSVTFRPYNVDMLDAVTANFLGDNIQCWMQIQVGKGPWSSEVAGIVKIGQTMTMVLAIKDDENRFDMLVRNCVAHDGKHQPIQLVDEYGCVARPKIMGRFQKVRNFGPAATVVSYAHFQAFKFPDSMSVHFQCVIQVCRYECPEPVCAGGGAGGVGGGGAPGGELAGPSGAGPAPPQSGDYATSGTEMVASKEPPLLASGGGYFGGAAAPAAASYANHSHVQLKLDESQGRVQVKLDTSMMAGLNGRPAAQPAGPLPPHLLHMAGGGAVSGAHYRQAVATSSGGGGGQPAAIASAPAGGANGGASLISRHHHHHAQHQHAGPARLQQQQASANLLAAQPAQLVHYSPQYGASPSAAAAGRRSAAAYANRLGELAPASLAELAAQITPPYEADYNPLSLIGSPRGLRLSAGGGGGATTPTLQALDAPTAHFRARRAIAASSSAAAASAGRAPRHLSPPPAGDSTSVQTRKSIQVVSPDDVAFSLLDPSEEEQRPFARARPLSAPQPPAASSSVCFTTTRFLWGLLVTLAALVSSIVIVTYVILKQRSQLDQKLASVFVDPARLPASGVGAGEPLAYCRDAAPSPALSDAQLHHHNNLRQQQQQHQHQQLLLGHKLAAAAPAHQLTSERQQQRRRQQEELQQRHNYLARLYSQFAPANYWR